MVLGSGLAKLIEAEIGGEIVVMGQGADGSIAADIFTLTGIIDTGDDLRDSMFAVVGRSTLQELLVIEGRFHELSISLKRSLQAEKWAKLIQPEFPDMVVTSWYDFLPQISGIIEIWDSIKFIFAMVFYFAVILICTNTMYMALLERLREFGIMGAIGMKRRRLSFMIVLEGFLMSSIAGIAGGLVGCALTFFLKDHYIDLSGYMSEIAYAETVIQPRLRTYPALDNILMPVVIIALLGTIVALFPARRLERHRPVDVLREV